jgi:hypothetical protein
MFALLHGDPRFRVEAGASPEYRSEVRSSVFCLCPRGFAPWSRRLFDAAMLGCIPVIIADTIELPFEEALDYRSFTVKVGEADLPNLAEILSAVPPRVVAQKRLRLAQAARAFVYAPLAPSVAAAPLLPTGAGAAGSGDDGPPRAFSGTNGDAFDMILQALARRRRGLRPLPGQTWSR